MSFFTSCLFSDPETHTGYHIIFSCHMFLESSYFSSLFLMTLAVLRSPGGAFCTTTLDWGLCAWCSHGSFGVLSFENEECRHSVASSSPCAVSMIGQRDLTGMRLTLITWPRSCLLGVSYIKSLFLLFHTCSLEASY